MPALPAVRAVPAPQADSLAPRNLDAPSPIAPQPALDHSPNGAVGRAALEQRTVYAGIIPSYYNNSGPAAGTVVGLVLGCVAGFLLVVWLLYSLVNLNGVGGGAAIAGEEEIVVRRPRRASNSGRSRRSTRTEVREYSRSPRRREQVIVEERRAPPRPRSVVVEERVRVPGDDVVEVIEERDEFRRSRGSGRRSGGYQ